jgi:D-glycero-alpha-D-manno-heptose-7-phosphate kinase
MIISRTPLRMSFVGGGSDLPVFYRKFGGAVVSTAINQFVYITVNKKFDERIRVSYSKTEEARSVDRIKHPLVRESMKLLGLDGGLEITSIADIPARGSGLGSSSTFTVGLLHALHAYAERYASAEQLAREACVIEIERCGEPIGKQDQYAAAFGGLNFIQFHPDDSVTVEPLLCKRDTLRRMEEQTLVFYTGITRSASAILQQQQTAVASEKKKQAVLRGMVDLARQLRGELQKNRVDAFGEIIHAGWELKKSLTTGISTTGIDDWYEKARQAGAIGGKLLGAGTGGFLMFCAPPDRHEAIARALAGLRRMDFRFEPQGSRIIFVHH